MYTDDDLDGAVTDGILSADVVAAFREYMEQRSNTLAVDEEHFRLISGFNDIFVVIACGLLLGACAWIGFSFQPWAGPALVAVVSWLLAEFFTRKRRMALPSIALLGAFVVGSGGCAFAALYDSGADASIAGLVAALAAALHWIRFRVPVTVAAGVAGLVLTCATTLKSLLPTLDAYDNLVLFACGLAVFFLAMRWDSSDIRRQTRRSDVAFWLHLLAAPLLVHPVFGFLGVREESVGLGSVALVMGLYAVLALISLLVDRRALMVSALGYVVYVFASLFDHGDAVSLGFAFSSAGIGAALLLLSAFWHSSRSAVIGLVPVRISAFLPPLQRS
ncbi:hypothetical protein HEQ62_04690 [Haematospirillum jordaniae]|uniref:DUF4401 domain-containing protein n=1 Tax=Haematospirillum jordaniae TaxID=1549855 RepID=A0A143DF09_9PROT|nr:hypothetical protein [Haematospirillum jordaniae]AMW34853.1 hypothetical protein AY555_06315 [Haematospirillum jordaniae]NKD45384.1 hypothetical protein [Haematospirillum jordaniae]NKD56768.1 hypothetical protein [Haematospirillum jordaniae]NKD59076.1 hypothetical protein [Haematospirillum jordaniae]NKD66692.1 hypothetical protein [Haematospirillum jordaniae]